MLLIAAALEEELKTAMEFCGPGTKVLREGISLWQAERGDRTIGFLKTGVGPRRSAASLRSALEELPFSHILVVGYAGALVPDLKLGDVVAVEKAIALSFEKDNPAWESVRLDGSFAMVLSGRLAESAKSSGLCVRTGNVLTSPYVLGNPENKKLLYEKFRGLIVDMETAALAQIADSFGVPISCVRVVSDEAADTFLLPLDPSTPVLARARKVVGSGPVRLYREWKKRTAVAQKSLTRFFSGYL